MFDPLTIAAASSSLVFSALKICKALNDIRKFYISAPTTIASIATECSVISAVLSRVQRLALTQKDPLYAQFENDPQLIEVFDNVLNSCATTFWLLEGEVLQIEQKDRLKFMWNEDTMMSYLDQLRGMGTTINTLLLLMQSEAISDIRCIISKREKDIVDIVDRTSILCKKAETDIDRETIRTTSWAELEIIDTQSMLSQQFDFDTILRDTAIYRRAFERSTRAFPTRMKELEQEIEQTRETLLETESIYKARELENEKAYREKLMQLGKDYTTAVHYVQGAEKMLKRMKDVLTKYKDENAALRTQIKDRDVVEAKANGKREDLTRKACRD